MPRLCIQGPDLAWAMGIVAVHSYVFAYYYIFLVQIILPTLKSRPSLSNLHLHALRALRVDLLSNQGAWSYLKIKQNHYDTDTVE